MLAPLPCPEAVGLTAGGVDGGAGGHRQARPPNSLSLPTSPRPRSDPCSLLTVGGVDCGAGGHGHRGRVGGAAEVKAPHQHGQRSHRLKDGKLVACGRAGKPTSRGGAGEDRRTQILAGSTAEAPTCCCCQRHHGAQCKASKHKVAYKQ